MAREVDAGYMRHFQTTKNLQDRFGTSSELDVTITPQGYVERDAAAETIYEALPRKGGKGVNTKESWRVDVFTSPGRSYDSGLALAEKLGSYGVRIAVEADPLLSGYDLGPLAGMTLKEMRAREGRNQLPPGSIDKIMAYKLGFSTSLAIGRQTSEGHYQQVQLAVENRLVTTVDTDLVLFIGNSSTIGVIEDWAHRDAVYMQTGVLPPARYRQPTIPRGEVGFFRAVIDTVMPPLPNDSAMDAPLLG